MRYLNRMSMSFAILLCASSAAGSSAPAQDPKETGTITGRVTLDGRPAQGVMVTATRSGSDQKSMVERILKQSGSPKTVTDSDGRYRLESLPAGQYYVTPTAPALVNLGGDKQETLVTVTRDATVERIDFSLTRGGVISGKITDNDGRPVIAALVTLKPIGTSYSASFYSMGRNGMFFTDDRGIYRIFGLPAGRYLVSAGNSDNSPFGQSFAGAARIRTYHPGVTDEPSAKPVEVAAGAEALGVDIKMAVTARGFVVSGRVVDAETRKPVGIAVVAYGKPTARRDTSDKDADDDDDEDDDDATLGAMSGFTLTNAKGEFRFESVAPGSYQATTESMSELSGASEYYTDPVDFEVRSSNLDNLEIPVHRGASISGVVFVENAGPEAREQLATLVLSATILDEQQKPFSVGEGKVAADGSFRIGGLKAGEALITASPSSVGRQKFSLRLIERNGVEQPDGILVQPNEQITGLRIMVTQADCVIRGHVTVKGGSLSNSETYAFARSTTSPQAGYYLPFPVDTSGNFVIDGLAPGDYEVEVKSFNRDGTKEKQIGSARQSVTVVSGLPAEVNLVLDLSATQRDK